jgi:hypothetical protein
VQIVRQVSGKVINHVCVWIYLLADPSATL